MIELIQENLGNIIVGGLLIIAVVIAIRSVRKDQKKGGCCGECQGCASTSKCQK